MRRVSGLIRCSVMWLHKAALFIVVEEEQEGEVIRFGVEESSDGTCS